MVAAAIRTVFAQPDSEHGTSQLDMIATMLGRQFPAVETMLTQAKADLLAFTASRWRTGRRFGRPTPLERVNKEINDAPTSSVCLPQPPALLRLAGAVLVQIHE